MVMGVIDYVVVAASSADKLAEEATNKLTAGFQPLGPPAFYAGKYYMSMAKPEFAAGTSIFEISAKTKKDPDTLTVEVFNKIGDGVFPFGNLVVDDEGNLTQFLSDNLFAPMPRAGYLDGAVATAEDIVTALKGAGMMAGSAPD